MKLNNTEELTMRAERDCEEVFAHLARMERPVAEVVVAQAELQVTGALMGAMERPEMYQVEEPGRGQPPESLVNLQANSILAVAEVVLLMQVPPVTLQLVQVPLSVELRKME